MTTERSYTSMQTSDLILQTTVLLNLTGYSTMTHKSP